MLYVSVASTGSEGMPNGQMDLHTPSKSHHHHDNDDLNDDMDADDESEEDKNSEGELGWEIPYSLT